MTKPYSVAFKQKMVQRLTGKRAMSASQLARETARWRVDQDLRCRGLLPLARSETCLSWSPPVRATAAERIRRSHTSRGGTFAATGARMRIASLCLIVVFAAVVSACSQAENDLAEARERWERHGQGNYQFIWKQSCYCLVEAVQPIYITVQANEIASAVYVSDQQPV